MNSIRSLTLVALMAGFPFFSTPGGIASAQDSEEKGAKPKQGEENRRGRRGRRGGRGGWGMDPAQLQKDLGLDDAQTEQLKQMWSDMRTQMRDARRKAQEEGMDMREAMRSMRKQMEGMRDG